MMGGRLYDTIVTIMRFLLFSVLSLSLFLGVIAGLR